MKLPYRLTLFSLVATCVMSAMADEYVSEVWSPDLGNGKYINPIIDADYSDPDVVRVGDDYYMTASSFSDIPGLPVLHSKDLVNWTIIGHAIAEMPDYAKFKTPNHGNAVWAPSIRYHNGEFFIYYGDPDLGIFMTKTKNPAGPWEPLTLVHKAKGIIDCCPFWDEDGKAYLPHGYAGSRAGVKSIIGMIEMTPDGKSTIGQDRIIYDGHLDNETIEGAKDWFIHFQDKGPYGRVVNLEPMKWLENGWPVIGVDPDGDERGVPVRTYKKPNVGKTYPRQTPQDSDEFDSIELGKQWQWKDNPSALWYYCDAAASKLRLFSNALPENAKTIYDLPNLLLQKFPARNFTATAKVQFFPRKKDGKLMEGERAGIVVMGYNFGTLSLMSRKDGIYLVQTECYKANKGGEESEVEAVKVDDGKEMYLRMRLDYTGPKVPKQKPDYTAEATFYYSFDGKKYTKIGNPVKVDVGHWIGAKFGMYCSRSWSSNDSGWLDIDWFRVTKK